VSALLTAKAVRLHLELSSYYYCTGAQRLQNRINVLRDLSFIIEDVHELLLIYTYEDLFNLYLQKYNCLKNATLCTWNYTLEANIKNAFIDRKYLAWQLISDAEEFKAYLDLFYLKFEALVLLKCIEERILLVDLDANIVLLETAKADLTFLRSHALNGTKLYFIFDYFMDFAIEVEAITALVTNLDNAAAIGLNFTFTVISDLVNLDDTLIANVVPRFCLALRTIVIAHFGADITGHVCNPLLAIPITTSRKRQTANLDGTESNVPADPFSISTQTNVAPTSTTGSTTGTSSTGSTTGATPPTSGASIAMVSIGAVIVGVAAWLL